VGPGGSGVGRKRRPSKLEASTQGADRNTGRQG